MQKYLLKFLFNRSKCMINALVCVCFLLGHYGFAQQDAHFTQYMFNPQYINPGYAGTVENITGMLFHRKQWMGFEGSPVTQNFSGIYPFKRKKIALALNIVNDKLGVTNNMIVTGTFSYYLKIRNGRLSFGLAAGAQNYAVNGSQLNIADNTDLAFTGSNVSVIRPNFDFGIYYKHYKYYAGISSTHLNNPGRRITAYRSSDPANTARHYYATAGYYIQVTDDFKLTPSVLTRYSESKEFVRNFSADFTMLLDYKDFAWIGQTYRSADAWCMFIGVNVGKVNPEIFKENIKIGYAHDFTVAALPRYNQGTHEIFISYEYAPKVKRMMPKFK